MHSREEPFGRARRNISRTCEQRVTSQPLKTATLVHHYAGRKGRMDECVLSVASLTSISENTRSSNLREVDRESS